MRFLVLCVALSTGVVVFAHPEGETSPVAAPAIPAAEDTAASSKAAEPAAEGEEESLRPKRWYGFYPGPYGPHYGFNNPFPFNMVHSGSFGTPVVAPGAIQGRTGARYGVTPFRQTATLNQLLNYQRHQDRVWRNPNFNQNLPQVIDTAAFPNFNNGQFNQGFNFNNMPFTQPGFNNFNNRPFQGNNFNNRPFQGNNFNNRPFQANNFNNRPDIIDTQAPESRTRFPIGDSVHSPSGFNPVFVNRGQPFQPGWNNHRNFPGHRQF